MTVILESIPVLGFRLATAVAPLPISGNGAVDCTSGRKFNCRLVRLVEPAVVPCGWKATVCVPGLNWRPADTKVYPEAPCRLAATLPTGTPSIVTRKETGWEPVDGEAVPVR